MAKPVALKDWPVVVVPPSLDQLTAVHEPSCPVTTEPFCRCTEYEATPDPASAWVHDTV